MIEKPIGKETFCPNRAGTFRPLAGSIRQNIDIERLLRRIGLGISKGDAKRFLLAITCEV